MWNYKTPGIPDESFERIEKVPITKEEVRTIQISKARLKPGQIVYDIGCGSGSISVEAAFQIETSGKVLSIDYDENAVELTKKNLKKFNLSNVAVIFGNAKEKINDLESADVIFIGGTIATFIFEDIEGEERRWSSIGFMIILFFGSIIVAKGMKMQLPSSDRKKIVTQALGSYVFLYLFSWIVTYTLVHSGSASSGINL